MTKKFSFHRRTKSSFLNNYQLWIFDKNWHLKLPEVKFWVQKSKILKIGNQDHYIIRSEFDCKNLNELDHYEESWSYCIEHPLCKPLLDSYSDMPDPYKEQIKLDLKRTFTDDPTLNISKMLNILRAYAKRNSAIGYCQGMNYLGGMLVRVMPNEEEAFWTMCWLFETILPLDYFCLMTEVLIDQRVFIALIQKYKSKLFKHLQKIGLDFALISFQWFVWLLSSNLDREVSESIWDLLFLEGTVNIFRAALAILNILEHDLMKLTEFNDMYVMLDTSPKEIIKTPDIIIKNMSKFMQIKPKLINKLREKNRYIVMEEQLNVWLDNSRAGWPTEKDTPMYKRVKLLNKFFMLNKAIRASQSISLSLESTDFTLSGSFAWNYKWPTCLYDFTVRSRIWSYFVFRVAKPVKIVHDYFGNEEDEEFDGGLADINYIFVPFANKDVTIYDTLDDRRRKRIQSEHYWIAEDSKNDEEDDQLFDPDQIIMSREYHLWVYKHFENHFQKLFDEESNILFQNWTVHSSYGNEIDTNECMDTFIREILSSWEIDKIKKDSNHEDKDLRRKLFSLNRQYTSYRLQPRKITESSDKSHDEKLSEFKKYIEDNDKKTLGESKLHRYGSFMVPKDVLDKQILQTAVDIISQSIIKSNFSDDSEEDV